MLNYEEILRQREDFALAERIIGERLFYADNAEL